VPAGTRSSLRPLSFEGEATKAKLGRTSREDASPCQSFINSLVPRTQRSASWRCAAEPGPMQQRVRGLLGPGSAQHRYAPHRVRDTRRRLHSVIASAAKQSRLPPRNDSGLLRCARNDGVDAAARQNFCLVPRTQRSASWRCAAEPGPMQQRVRGLLGPGSAERHCVPHCVRDTRRRLHSVIASAAKQSRVFPRGQSGLLRCARNDDAEAVACRHRDLVPPTQRRAGPLPFFACRSALVTKPSCSETKRSRGPRLAAKLPRRERF